jgi:hypothetical protein
LRFIGDIFFVYSHRTNLSACSITLVALH